MSTHVDFIPNTKGYLLGKVMRESTARVIVTDTNDQHIPGLHREGCTFFKEGYQDRWPMVPSHLAVLAFEAEQARNAKGVRRSIWFCERCMIQPV